MKTTLKCWSGWETLRFKSNRNRTVHLQAKTSYNGLHLERKAYSGSNSSVVQGPSNLKKLFKIGRLNAQTHQNAS